jgi:AcrR family transcriptional regulator
MSDSENLSLSRRPRSRRTQAERTAETRARILSATLESINEVGFQRTTAAEITRRSGLTWGAVQHQFGSKNGILGAVLEDSFNRFAEGLLETFDSLGPDTSLRERIDVFLDTAWSHFRSTHYRATFEILLEDSAAGRTNPDLDSDPSWQEEMLRAWTGIWRRLFSDVQLKRRRALMLQHYTISTLSGLASMSILAGEEGPFVREELDLLGRTLAAEFASSETDPASRS